MAVEKLSTMSNQEFKKLEKAADISMFKISLIVIVGFILLILAVILQEIYFNIRNGISKSLINHITIPSNGHEVPRH
jgi:TRAP-type C4-dicarboxylate transport system permease small subunit